ncbi:MAG: aspartyl protease family protein [Pseudomonadota bacterium]
MEAVGRFLAGALAALWLANSAVAAAECLAPPPMDSAQQQELAQQSPPPAPASSAAIGATRLDNLGRVVAPVTVNGQGPYRFIVDTGANRSVLSSALAQRLGIQQDGVGDIHSIEGVSQAPMSNIGSIAFGRMTLSSGLMPILNNERVLAGEAGILGVDGMEDRRLRIDFEDHCIEILPADHARPLGGWIQVRGALRFGHLVVLRARVRDVPINVLLDTGSDGTLGNVALRNALQHVALSREDLIAGRAYTAGRPIVFDQAVVIPEMDLGDLAVTHVTAFIGDFHVFSLWGLSDEPTLLIGMDVLSQTREIAIDYRRAIVHFRVRRRT